MDGGAANPADVLQLFDGSSGTSWVVERGVTGDERQTSNARLLDIDYDARQVYYFRNFPSAVFRINIDDNPFVPVNLFVPTTFELGGGLDHLSFEAANSLTYYSGSGAGTDGMYSHDGTTETQLNTDTPNAMVVDTVNNFIYALETNTIVRYDLVGLNKTLLHTVAAPFSFSIGFPSLKPSITADQTSGIIYYVVADTSIGLIELRSISNTGTGDALFGSWTDSPDPLMGVAGIQFIESENAVYAEVNLRSLTPTGFFKVTSTTNVLLVSMPFDESAKMLHPNAIAGGGGSFD